MGTNNQFSIKTGDLLYFINHGHKYRVLGVNTDHILLCQVDTSVLNLLSYETPQIVSDLQSSRATFENDSYAMPVFDKSALPAKYRERYEEVMSVILQVLNFYKSDLTKLIGRKQKPELDAILANSSLSRVTFWRLFRQYLQSGMNPASLIDARILGANLGKTYQHVSKAGRPAKHFDTIGVILTDEVKMRFDEGIKYYKETRGARQIDAFDYMNNKYYTKTEIKNGVIVHALVSENMRPTLRQFSNYLRSSLSQQDREIAKSSAREVRNNKRVLTSDSIMDVSGPGDMVEIDACESDIYLVSSSGAIVGRPIVYFMIDVFSKIILAMGVSFDNNSYLGLTNLFLNLADNKEEYCKRFGLQYEDLRTWPSNILPNRVRMDRGSDMISNEMERLCVELNIRRDNTSGASGSLKGTVEQSFYQMEQSMKANLQKNGLIEKRYDSQHKNNASLTLYDYTRMVISYVVNHNQKMSPTYPLTKEMVDDNSVSESVPVVVDEGSIRYY